MQQHEPPLTVLLVEDDDDHALLIRRCLAELPTKLKVERSIDADSTLQLLHAARARGPQCLPDLVLLDLGLPDRSGLEVLADIKADEATRHVPVIVLSTSEEKSDVTRAYQHHANSFLVKRGDLYGLREMLRTMGQYWTICNRS
ncbi:MAG: response regulator [Planctomycetota bacterium]